MNTDNFAILIKFFIDEFGVDFLFSEEVPENRKERVLKDIFFRINDIQTVFERLTKYETYFQIFYPANLDQISEAEAIEYHLHSYIQEFYSLQQKIERLIKILKNKISVFDIKNPEDVKELLLHTLKQVNSGLSTVVELRGTHVHDMSVRDNEISMAKAIRTIQINDDRYNTPALTDKYNKIISDSKEKYITQSNYNKGQIIGLKNYIAPRVGFIVAALYEKNTQIFKEKL